MLGMVNESDLCYLGGFPGEKLKDVFGIWNEEIDTLYPNERGAVVMEDKTYAQKDYAELIHTISATTLGVYAKDFYAGMPAFTVNSYGKGKAYYQAFRDTGEFWEDVVLGILTELNIPSTLSCLPLMGITAHKRTSGKTEYLFLENYGEKQLSGIELGDEYTDMVTGTKVKKVDLDAYSISILKR